MAFFLLHSETTRAATYGGRSRRCHWRFKAFKLGTLGMGQTISFFPFAKPILRGLRAAGITLAAVQKELGFHHRFQNIMHDDVKGR